MSNARILVTGATGQLGRLVVQSLRTLVGADRIIVAVRDPAKAADLAAVGVEVRAADYNQPAQLATAFAGVDRVLLISSSEVGSRVPQHRHVIDAAVKAGVKLLAYTSLLQGDASPLPLKAEHVATEAYLQAAGLPFVLLRNGWYTENYNGFIPSALEHGALFGAAGEGRIAAAARADYAEAAARVIAEGEAHAGKIYELAGDQPFTLADWAATLAQAAGKPVAYQNLPEAEFRGLLVKVGLPEPVADLLASSDAGAAQGGLFDDSHTLSRLIGRPTTSLVTVLTAALAR
ncbi:MULTISPECIES: SDR family oxidoreductase [unclassified Azospirillum]|uniref:SDR family oxidoreductase n=1 Tax=unclassified Azospirillum TaxID=2630922 RepID=UPI000B650DC0|nr:MULTISPECIES: SDR family oxidoreductase [unclassified Azospirillum]SNR93034.1 NAD(P)H dehydrogenase (quinone) [Azospirillum sp. RU38E]SNS08944.1 NAD(P)H dehydrogenase (quinone) [Azospirillum sp. RU37A]